MRLSDLAPVMEDVPEEVAATPRSAGASSLALDGRPMAQRSELLRRFRAVCSAPQCELLRLGAEPPFVQFGPVVVSHDSVRKATYVLVLAVVTNEHGTVRARDCLLAGQGPPHLTLGKVAEGSGWVREVHSACVRWVISGPPRVVPDKPTLEWSQEEVRTLDLSAFSRCLSEDVELLGASARGPVAADVLFEGDDRFLLVGGEALRVYRELQARFEQDPRTSIGFVRVPFCPVASACVFRVWISLQKGSVGVCLSSMVRR